MEAVVGVLDELKAAGVSSVKVGMQKESSGTLRNLNKPAQGSSPPGSD